MTDNNFTDISSLIWSVADLLRGDFKQSQYGRIILPFTLLRRLECVLAKTKPAVLAQREFLKSTSFPESVQEQFLLEKSELSFFNTSQFTLADIGQTDIKANLESYIKGFSKNTYEIFKLFNFKESIALLNDANLLFKVIQSFTKIDLSLEKVSNHTMGLAFEELIRKFAESSNETAGEHFTPP